MKKLNTGRRLFLETLMGTTAAAFFSTPGLYAEYLAGTPPLTEGPYYPDRLPLDTDNDLVILKDSLTPAVGQITHLSGRVLDTGGSPIKDAVVEIWQSDVHGAYINSRSPNRESLDRNFQGFGTFQTAASGEYRFRTVKPGIYEGRTRHIHVKVKKGGQELLTTQVFFRGEQLNASDMVLNELRDPFERALVIADFRPVAGAKLDEIAGAFDIVVGRTPRLPE
jgi:protocatechuate 3,4-dioxygenase beta subunit